MREQLDLPVLCQGDDAISELVRVFASDAQTCLFGTLSLWQGVDVPGSALQLVVIDRLPFPRPDDPLASARARYVESHGGSGFMQVSATQASLPLGPRLWSADPVGGRRRGRGRPRLAPRQRPLRRLHSRVAAADVADHRRCPGTRVTGEDRWGSATGVAGGRADGMTMWCPKAPRPIPGRPAALPARSATWAWRTAGRATAPRSRLSSVEVTSPPRITSANGILDLMPWDLAGDDQRNQRETGRQRRHQNRGEALFGTPQYQGRAERAHPPHARGAGSG